MTYQTQPGTLPHRAVAFFKTKPEGFELSTVELADALDFDQLALVPCLINPRKHGVLRARVKPGSKSLLWSLGDGTPEAKPHDYEPDPPMRDPTVVPAKKAKRGEARGLLLPGTAADAPTGIPFNAAAYIDGSLIVVGAEVRDGAVILSPAQVMKLRRFIAWMPA
jgi:hypothetical protein